MDKKALLKLIWSYVVITIGTSLLAFGAVIFLEKSNLVAGGVSGIAIIVQNLVSTDKSIVIYDYVVYGLMIMFWVLGFIFIGKEFAVKTLYSTAIYIGLTALFFRITAINNLGAVFAGDGTPGYLILCGIFGGVFVGSGVALTFIAGGSTGGVDVVQLIVSKYWHIKESISSFIIDATVIVIGMITMSIGHADKLIPALCGILSSFVTALLIEIVYIKNQTAYQVDIISDKWLEISRYAQDELERGATIIRAEGGYKGEERVILRVVFDRFQYEKIKRYIASVDPKAFVTYTQTNAVFGEGFRNHYKSTKKVKK